MIKSITFQGLRNFDSNLYALEVKSRFINQLDAHGFYKGYGNELAATVVGNSVVIQTGAFVIASRMGVVVSDVSVPVTIANGLVGAIIARVETFRVADDLNITFLVRTASTPSDIQLTQEDVYADEAETTNRVFEFIIYTFDMFGDGIRNLTRAIQPIEGNETVAAMASNAINAANNATNIANQASSDAAILATQIGERQGTTIVSSGTAEARLDLDEVIFDIFGGGA